MTKEQNDFIGLLKNKLNDVDHPMVGDFFYEWKIENWNLISNKECVSSPEFNALGHKWKLEIYPNGVDTFYKGNISTYLNRNNEKDDYSVHIAVNRVFFIRNYYDTYCYKAATLPIEYLGKSVYTSGHPNLISKSQLYSNIGNNKCILENNKCVFGVYFQVYKTEKGQFDREITTYIDDEDKVVKAKYLYEWEVSNWSKIRINPKKSPEFTVGDLRLVLDLYKDGDGYDNRKYVSIFLKCLNPGINNPAGTWVNAVIFIRNCDKDTNCCIYDVLEMRKFDKNNIDWGFSKLIKQKDLFKKNSNSKHCILENDKCVIGAYIHVYGQGKVNNVGARIEGNQPSMSNASYQEPPPSYSAINPNPIPPVQQYQPSQSPTYPNPPYSNPSYPNPPYPNPPYPNPPYPNPPYPNPPYQNPPYQYPPYQYPPYQYPPYQNNQPYQNQPPSYYPNSPFPPTQDFNNTPAQQYPPYQGPPPMYNTFQNGSTLNATAPEESENK